MPRARREAAQTREVILDAAHELFYWQGIRATGVDRVAAAAGVAPTTLYRLFASKDDLVAAYLDRNATRYREWFGTAARGPDPTARILAVFDALAEQTRPGHCRGCPFLQGLAEYPESDSAPHRVAVQLKAWVAERFTEFAGSAELGDALTLVFEGAYASVAALGSDGPARRARDAAAGLLGAP